jgi:hypothetical protein
MRTLWRRLLRAVSIVGLAIAGAWLWLVLLLIDLVDYARAWWDDLTLRRLKGPRFLLGFAVVDGNPACCPGYRQLYLGWWLLEWRTD